MTPPLPAVWAEGIARRAGRRRGVTPLPVARRRARLLLRRLAWPVETSCSSVYEPELPVAGVFWSEDEVKRVTAGRRLLPREVYQRLLWLKGRRAFRDDVVPRALSALMGTLFRLARNGWGHVRPGIVWEPDDTLRCARCGQAEVTPWACSRCGQLCFECETCGSLGPIRSCDVLFEGGPRLAADDEVPPEPALVRRRRVTVSVRGLPFSLSPAQEAASQEVLAFLESPQREALLWAACGAGKTEVAFSAMAAVLQRGDDVLFAVPRRDVAAELGRRLAEYVAPLPVEVAYGGAPARSVPSGARGGEGRLPRLVVATTHQCLRWGPTFPFVVLDEADAFPYAGERFLREALLRTVAPGGKLLTMTATPERDHLALARRGRIALITIPARHHGHPLPVPRWCKVKVREAGHRSVVAGSLARGDDAAVRPVMAVLQTCVQRGPTFVFVPTVNDAERVGAALARRFGGWDASVAGKSRGIGAASVHSADPRRDEKIEAFRRGDVGVLVATAVLERGVTVPSAQVVVLDADREDIWDERALVQMAGRAGRSTEAPDGLVYFMSRRWNGAMARAAQQIRELNDRAERGGFLKGEGP